MSRNTMEQGKPRIGWMIDGDPQTPEVAVMLELTEDAIHLTIPTKGMFGSNDPYARWFSHGTHYGDDPEKTKYRYSPPKNLFFYDHLGPVVLIGCWAGASSSSSNGAGFGRVSAEYAAVGQHNRNLDKINGIRTEMPGLNAWTGITSRSSKVTFDAKQRSRILTVEMSSPATTRLSRTKNLTLAPTWRTSAPESDAHATHDVVQLVTETRRGDNWDAHLAPHRAVQDLNSLSAWRQFGFSRIEMGKTETVHPRRREVAGASEEIRWSELVTHRLRKHKPWKTDPRFLFRYDDIGAAGVARWLRLRAKYERATLPLASVIGQHGMFVEAAVLQTGIAVEALGYQLASEAVPSGLNSRGQISYNDAMDRIARELPFVPVADVEVWKSRSRRSYMGVKHADHPTPDMLSLANAYRRTLSFSDTGLRGVWGAKRARWRRDWRETRSGSSTCQCRSQKRCQSKNDNRRQALLGVRCMSERAAVTGTLNGGRPATLVRVSRRRSPTQGPAPQRRDRVTVEPSQGRGTRPAFAAT